MFVRYLLRTTDLDAARAFYEAAIGLALPDGMADRSVVEAWPLHEQARARGAPAHWLGQIAVDDVGDAVAKLVARGCEPLGPALRAQDGTPFATLRDPSGAVFGVRTFPGEGAAASADGEDRTRPAWHQLHTRELDVVWSLYSETFGWVQRHTVEEGDLEGGYRLFSASGDGPIVGGMGNTARRPGVHPHWLFCFSVTDIDAVSARALALGGTVMAPVALPDGRRVMACEDPQGGAFGLAERG